MPRPRVSPAIGTLELRGSMPRISPFYDPMIAKVVTHGPDRTTALAALADAVTRTEVAGSTTNAAYFNPLARRATLSFGGTGIVAHITARPDGRFQVRPEGGEAFVLSAGAGDAGATVAAWPGHVTVFEAGRSFDFAISDPFARAAEIGEGTSSMRAPMPGLVKLVRATKGDKVAKGQPLLVLEAMKMEHTITATHDGVISEIAAEGAQVTDGTVLVRFEE
jgi:3-methylcrotonyl-CoA carboxylase alpha subunit